MIPKNLRRETQGDGNKEEEKMIGARKRENARFSSDFMSSGNRFARESKAFPIPEEIVAIKRSVNLLPQEHIGGMKG